ncbi:2-amino-4-hydroxy-6-hydroxymethyldihydropteridine diphosphokinase [Bacteroidales bacterium]|nr:2-amino-4-hydroxy-6-hydroxymethyldihydropteridine diphosphokinase [Bacteroidales bacterium]
MTKTSTVYLSLGSNMGDKKQCLLDCTKELERLAGKITAYSSMVQTSPWGYISENTFLNQAIALSTKLNPQELLKTTQSIEKSLGRVQKNKNTYQDRTIDIDILFFDDLIIESQELSIPHPLLHLRDFVLEPLCEIAANKIHPKLKKNIKELNTHLKKSKL